jgi:hypothetical protein
MLMRMYLPTIEVPNGQYQIPGAVKARGLRSAIRRNATGN